MRASAPFSVALSLAILLASAVAYAQSDPTAAARRRYESSQQSANIQGVARSMDSSDPMERLDGLRQLTSLEDDHAIDLLLQALGDRDVRVRAKAIDSCADLRATAATPVLIQQLFLRDTQAVVKKRIIAALGKIGDPRAAAPIMEVLTHDIDPKTRGTAIFALGDLGAAESLATLNQLARDEPDPTLQRLAREAASKVRYAQAARANEATEPLETFLRPAQP